MGKLNSPLLSLGARGTIGDTLTLQKRGQDTIARTKPIPAYRYTLPQAYQRWLYEDYAYLWRQQSLATKQEYATAGSRHHLTGFQYWMKYHLKNLPDIIGWWRLDETTGAVARDFSADPHNGVILGPSPADGVIAGGYFFDGINDIVRIDPAPSVSLTTCTVLCFLNTPPEDGIFRIPLFWNTAPHPTYAVQFLYLDGTGRLYVYLRNTAGVSHSSNALFTPDTWELRGIVWNGTTMWSVRNSALLDPKPCTGTVAPTLPLYLGQRPFAPQFWGEGDMDNLIIYNRALDATEIARWAGRRYPP